MGTRVFTDAQRLTFRTEESRVLKGTPMRSSGGGLLPQQISGNYKVMAIYDGTTGKQGLPDALEPTEAWIDASGLYRIGLNTGPTFQNIGPCGFDLYACQAPRQYAYDPTAAIVAELTSVWQKLNSTILATGDQFPVEGVYSLFRIVFTADAANPGCAVALTL